MTDASIYFCNYLISTENAASCLTFSSSFFSLMMFIILRMVFQIADISNILGIIVSGVILFAKGCFLTKKLIREKCICFFGECSLWAGCFIQIKDRILINPQYFVHHYNAMAIARLYFFHNSGLTILNVASFTKYIEFCFLYILFFTYDLPTT